MTARPLWRSSNPAMPAAALAFGVAAVLGVGIARAAGQASPPPAYASAAANVDSIVDKVIDRNPGLHSYKATAHLDLRQVSFPYLHPVLDGHAYVSAPGYTTFDYPHTPFYLKGITKFQGAFGDASRWLRCYDITVAPKSDGYALHMVPKIEGEIAYVDVLLGLEGTIDHVEWRYRENMKDYISLAQTYSTVDGHNIVTSQASDVALHHIRAKGTQTFSDFEFNVPVPTPSPTPSDPAHACDN
ncbi:MAG TPA: hypothetical protein VKF82_02850 [Candidatus Eremiobacteraceae bacterium]|nr:hypothetical protein [Candidatus Eremiobacteraceae bacterium]